MVLPTFTTSTPGPTYSTPQLIFAAVASLVLWGLYVLAQTVHYREHFLPVEGTAADPHGPLPTGKQAALSVVLLVVALVAVVGLAKTISPRLELLLHTLGAPRAVLGVLIAMLVLAPETLAAVRAARHTNLQTSFNLAYGSALASIGLTIPAVVIVSLAMDLPLILGLAPKDLVLLALTFVVSSITLVSGRTTWMLGAVHLVVFGAFVFLAFAP
jgi:Ca2+:H+ antiporter